MYLKLSEFLEVYTTADQYVIRDRTTVPVSELILPKNDSGQYVIDMLLLIYSVGFTEGFNRAATGHSRDEFSGKFNSASLH